MQPGAEPRWNAAFVGIPSFLRSVIATDLDRLDADVAVLRDTLRALAEHTRIVGFDLVEVNPMLDIGTGITSYLAAHTIVEFLGWLCAQPWWIAGRGAREAARAAPGPDAARRTGGGGGIPPRRARLRAIRFVPRPSFSDHDHQRGGSVMPRKRNGVSRREFIRDAALLSGSLAAVGLPGVARAQGTAAPPKLGAQLIGKLEGPELILDPAKWPTKFSEAPMLAELVKQGKLPPVEQRVPKEPLVIKPVHEIGRYGGTWRRGLHGPRRRRERQPHRVGRQAPVLGVHRDAGPPVRRREWLLADDGKSVTLYLRKGTSGRTESPSPPTTSCSGTRTST